MLRRLICSYYNSKRQNYQLLNSGKFEKSINVGRKDKNKNKDKNRARVTRNPNIDNYSKKLRYHVQQMLIT